MKNKTTNIKTFILLIAALLIFPLNAQAIPVLYSISGTATDGDCCIPQSEIVRKLTGYMVIDDEPRYVPEIIPPNSDWSVTYTIKSEIVIMEGIGFYFGPNENSFNVVRFESDGGPQIFDIDSFRGLFTSFGAEDVLFEYSDGTPYDKTDFLEWTELAPVIKVNGSTGSFGDFDYIGYLDFTLTAVGVPEPSILALMFTGLIGLVGVARHKKS